MNLHLNKEDFKNLINIASQNSNVEADIIEKDYYVTLMLKELSQKQNEIKAYFKGGTCLYKIFAPMQRFSEDIDLTVNVRDVSNSQAKKMLEHSSKKYSSLIMDADSPMNENRKGSITQVYKYSSCFEVPEDELQRYEKVKIEATSFTISEPIEVNYIKSLLVELLPETIREQVIHMYHLEEFSIMNISLERIFCDKLLAAEFYLERNELFDVSKHLYDIDTMLGVERIRNFILDSDKFIEILSYKRIEETLRLGSDLYEKPFGDFLLLSAVQDSEQLKTSFQSMQNKYVLDEQYRKSYEDVRNKMVGLQNIVCSLDDKEQRILHSEEFVEKVKEYNPEFGVYRNEMSNRKS